jgi:MoaA/NifB/PqqE/SkfB family radical SAM enzyme
MSIYCVAPWNGVTVREDGHVRTCCVGSISLGNLNTTTIDQIIKSDTLNQIRQDMLLDKPNLQNCASCVRSESQSGLATLRQHYNKFYSVDSYNEIKLKNLDIRWNNACNLACMYCNHTFSSTWENRLGINRSVVVKDYQEDLLNWILDHAAELEELMLVGGEPMLMKQNYALFNRLPDQCKVSIITNLSYDLPNLPCLQKLLNRPRENTLWNVSLENTGSQFEYVRTGAKWDQTRQNLEFLNKHWPDLVSINFVYSMFSAFSVVETVKELHNIGIKKINLFPINFQPTMDVFNMPDSIRLLAADELDAATKWHVENIHSDDQDLYPMHGANTLVNQLRNSTKPASITLKNFMTKIHWYDQYHNQQFNTLWPNIIDLVKKYL